MLFIRSSITLLFLLRFNEPKELEDSSGNVGVLYRYE